MLSPLAPTTYPNLAPLAGVRLATANCGIKYKDRPDLLVALMDEETSVAGVFTTSLTASAPVLACRKALTSGKARVLVVNSGNSNAFTGKAGEASVARVSEACQKMYGSTPDEFFMASTGIIGVPLPDEKITAALPTLDFSASWMDAARAIMTTDTYPKLATRTVTIGGVSVTIHGIAKGSGMIAPDMATMLGFIFTDAAIPAAQLQAMLSRACETTFNAVTVDGDTSTSDTLLMFATGKAANPHPALLNPHPDPLPKRERGFPVAPPLDINSISQEKKELTAPSPFQGEGRGEGHYDDFYVSLHSLLHELALHMAKDGEGAEKLVTIAVSGAESIPAAKKIGMSIANSPLVKTALAASDANWGRIVAAVGKAGEKADRDKLSINIGGVSVAKDGAADPSYREETIAAHMQGRDIHIKVDVGIGSGEFTVYSCDLTHRYIDINGSYRT
ncbi:MAG: bifunctional ornithine acetyltransferase/N-acetylglutamate synthase [Alphaproteobacteria bacterium]|nr:bifunctional ornithine acetyltransferase/N-acetylglutamate synthase [Alphaproteobacteria bacterium]